MNACTCDVAFGDTQRTIGLADEEVATTHPATCQEPLFAIGFDELQAMQRGRITHWDDERTIVKTYAVRLDTFLDQIGMIFGRISSSMPDEVGFLAGFSVTLIRFSFAFVPLGIHPCPMRSFFLWKSRTANVCPPLLMHSAAPI